MVTLALLVALSATPEEIPPPPRGQWVVDRTGGLSGATVDSLNRVCAALDASGAAQLGVAVIDSTGGAPPRGFATRLFNHWGVGRRDTNDGVLIFVAVKDRKAEIILGDGSKLSTSQTDAVMSNHIVANMKRGDLNQAVLSAANALAALHGPKAWKPHTSDNTGLGPDSYATPGHDQPLLDEELDAYVRGERRFPEFSPRSFVVDISGSLTPSQRAEFDVLAADVYATNQARLFLLVYDTKLQRPGGHELVQKFLRQVQPLSKLRAGVIAYNVGRGDALLEVPWSGDYEYNQVRLAEAALRGWSPRRGMTPLIEAQRFAQAALTTGIPPKPMGEVLAEGVEEHQVALSGGGLGVLGMLGLMLRRWNRNRVRDCRDCRVPMQRLDEAADDAHLTPGQRTEERIGSIDYDVWQCGRCNNVLVLDYGKFFSGYSKCGGCSSKALKSTSTTLSAATEYSEGLVQIDEHCAHCNHQSSYTRSTPRITRSDDSSSSSSSSFGGGSSSGGGSSGSW